MNIRNVFRQIRQYVAPDKPPVVPTQPIERVEPNAVFINVPTPRKSSFKCSTAKRAVDKRKAKAKRKEAQTMRRMNRRKGK